jgi:hypothetical protein
MHDGVLCDDNHRASSTRRRRAPHIELMTAAECQAKELRPPSVWLWEFSPGGVRAMAGLPQGYWK